MSLPSSPLDSVDSVVLATAPSSDEGSTDGVDMLALASPTLQSNSDILHFLQALGSGLDAAGPNVAQPTIPDLLRGQIEDFNQQADEAMTELRNNIIRAYLASNPASPPASSSQPTPTRAGSRPAQPPRSSQRWRQWVLINLVIHLSLATIVLTRAPPRERENAFADLLKSVTATMTVMGLGNALKKAAIKALMSSKQEIFAFLSGGHISDAILASFARISSFAGGFQAGAIRAAGMLQHTILHLVKALWRRTGPDDGRRSVDVSNHLSSAMEPWTTTNAVRITADVAAIVAAVQLAELAMGPVGVVPMVITSVLLSNIAMGIAQQEIELARPRARSTRRWLMSFVFDVRPFEWYTDSPDRQYALDFLVTKSVQCSISYCLVVDPVISRKTGHLYEKRVIEEAIAIRGRDPMTNLPAVLSDYIPCPEAKHWAKLIADALGLKLVRVEDSNGVFAQSDDN